MKKYIILALALVAMAGCAKDQSAEPEVSLVSFSAKSIGSKLSDDGSQWIAGDKIGVFMCEEDLGANFDRANVSYEATVGGASTTDFEASVESEQIYYPTSGNVDFYAYYPYADAVSESIPVSVVDQDADLDLLWASATGKNKSSGGVAFEFNHKLSKLQLVISSKDNVSTLEGLSTSISGVSATVSYGVANGEQVAGTLANTAGDDIELKTLYSTLDAQDNVTELGLQAILIPEALSAAVINFSLGGLSFYLNLSDTTELTAGYIHRYYISLGEDYADFDASENGTIQPWGEEDEDGLVSGYPN